MTEIPADLSYTAEHEWVRPARPAPGAVVTVGITAAAARSLGDLVFVQAPEVGADVTAGQVCGEVESTKSVSELFSPVTGTVTEVNPAAVADPAVVNADPYGQGWLFRVEVREVGELLDPEAYGAIASS